MMARMHVVVIGAGIIGAATALELQRDGHAVTILDPGPPGGPQAASYGNAGALSVASVIPMTAPGLVRKVPGWLADPLGPLAIRPAHLPALLPWLVRFVRAGSTEEIEGRLAGDPWTANGMLTTVRVERWTILLDGIGRN